MARWGSVGSQRDTCLKQCGSPWGCGLGRVQHGGLRESTSLWANSDQHQRGLVTCSTRTQAHLPPDGKHHKGGGGGMSVRQASPSVRL